MEKSQNKIINWLRSDTTLLCTSFVFGFASLSSWVPVFNVWLKDCGLSGFQIGYVAAIPWLAMMFIQPIWGYMADRFGKRKSLMIAVAASFLLLFIFPFFGKGLILISAFTLVLSLFFNPVLPLLDSLALDHIDEKKNITYSNIRFWGAPGYGLGAVLTGWLIPVFGINVVFFTSGAFLVLALLVIRSMIPPAEKNKAIDLDFKNLGPVLSNKMLLFFLFVIVVVSIGQAAITFFLSVYLRDIGASPEITGTAIGVQAFSELPFYFIAAWLLVRVRPGKVVLIAIFATALRLFFYSINHNPYRVIFIETMNGLTWTLLWISSVEYINRLVPAQWRTTGLSLLWAAYFGAGSVAGSVFSGWLYDHHNMQQVFRINSLMILGIALMAGFIFLAQKRKKLTDEA